MTLVLQAIRMTLPIVLDAGSPVRFASSPGRRPRGCAAAAPGFSDPDVDCTHDPNPLFPHDPRPRGRARLLHGDPVGAGPGRRRGVRRMSARPEFAKPACAGVLARDETLRRRCCAMVEGMGYEAQPFAAVDELVSACLASAKRFDLLVMAFPGDVSRVVLGLERVCRMISNSVSGLLILEERQIDAVHQVRWVLPRDFILAPFDDEEFRLRLVRCGPSAELAQQRPLVLPTESMLP